MNIETKQGQLNAMAWHVGRHVAMETTNHYWRFDGKDVELALSALLDNKRWHYEDKTSNAFRNSFTLIIHDGNCFNFNDGEEIVLTDKGCQELIAVLQHAMQYPKGLDEMLEEEERKRYGFKDE